MAVWTLFELQQHAGHEINITDFAGNACIVCEDCQEVLLEFHETNEEYYDGHMRIELGAEEGE